MEYIEYQHLLIFCTSLVASWFMVIYFLPRMLLNVYKRALLSKGFGEGPVSMNTLKIMSQEQFAHPLDFTGPKAMTTGVNRDTLLLAGFLDLSKGPQILQVPDMEGRYYSIQFTDPSKNINFAYVGKRTTGTGAGTYFISGPGWNGAVTPGMSQISSPNNSVFLIGRILVYCDSDLPVAHGLAEQIKLSTKVQVNQEQDQSL